MKKELKKKLKIGDRIRCASYTDLAFKVQELEKRGLIYRTWTEYDLGMKRKLYIEIVGKMEDGKRGYEAKAAAEATAFIEEATEAFNHQIQVLLSKRNAENQH